MSRGRSMMGAVHNYANAEPAPFTMADLERATQVLREQGVKPMPDGNYRMVIHPDNLQDIILWQLFDERIPSYRVKLTSLSYLAHERWRREAGRRASTPTALEAFDRARELG